jgi:hypothetical protein
MEFMAKIMADPVWLFELRSEAAGHALTSFSLHPLCQNQFDYQHSGAPS